MTSPRHWIFDRHDERTIALVSGLIGLGAAVLAVVTATQGDRGVALWNSSVAVVAFGSAGWWIRKFRKDSRAD